MTMIGCAMAGCAVGRFLGRMGCVSGIGAQGGQDAEADDGAGGHHPGHSHPRLGLS